MFVLRCVACLILLVANQLVAAETVPSLTVHIPMRDGTTLPTDLYYPAGATISNAYPCILLRLPAGRKAAPWVHLAEMAQNGYVVALQDTRSALDRKGKTLPFLSDGWDAQQDGYDTIQWLASSCYTNGSIGTLGFSAAGITQLMLAPAAPPALKCQYIGQAAASLYHHVIFPGGQLCKHQTETWLQYYARDFGVLSLVTSFPFYNDFWKKFDTAAVADRVQVPGLHYVGWYDAFLQGTIDSFVARQEKGQKGCCGTQKLVIGPWTHFWPQEQTLGDFALPGHAKDLPMALAMKRWFDFYLKEIPNGMPEAPAVTYYVMGPFDGSPSSGNVWRQSDKWPVPAVKTSFYLDAQHNKLLEKAPEATATAIYKSDPHDPVPTVGGRNLFLERGPKDQKHIEERKDVLVFTTDYLQEDLEVTGRIALKLYFSSDVEDTDITVRLTDVYPDGRSILIAEGISRTGIATPLLPAEKESVREIDIDLWSTSLVFAKGHAIRIAIAGSNYPKHEKNVNIGFVGINTGQALVAEHRLYTGKSYSSQLIMPVVRRGKQWLVEKQPEYSEVKLPL